MAITVQHAFTSPVPDGSHTGMLQPSHWNSAHIVNISGYANEYHNHQAGIEKSDITNLLPAVTIGAGTFTVDTGNVWMFDDVDMDIMTVHTIAASGTLTPADDTTTYVCADGTTNQWVLITSLTSIDYIRYVPYFIVYKRAGSTSLHTQNIALLAHGEVESHHQRVLSCERYARETGYEQISVDASLQLTSDAGVIWSVNTRYSPGAITAATRQFPCYHSGGVWTVGASHTTPVIENLYYDDGTGLVALSTGQWVINYIYRGVEDQDHMYTVLSTAYSSLEEAKASGVIGTLPGLISSHAVLIGRVIVQQSQLVDPVNIESAFLATFAAATPVTTHNDLTGIMGDIAGYHLNSFQYGALSSINATGASNSYLKANGQWGGVTAVVGTNYATQSVSTGASSHVLYGDGRWASVAGGGGGFTLNGQTSPQTLTAGVGLSHLTGTSGQTFQIATSYGAQFQASGNYASTNHSHTNYASQSVSTAASSHVLMGNGGWSSIPAQTGNFASTNAVVANLNGQTGGQTITGGAGISHVTATSGQTFQIATSYGAQFQVSGNYQTTGNYMSTAASQSFAATTAFATSSPITGTVNSTSWNIGLNTSAAGFAHTHAYQAAGNYISTGAVTGYGTNVVKQTTTANASNSYLQADGGWGGITAAVGTNLATQSVSTGASSHVLYGDGRWDSVAGGTGGGGFTLNGQTSPQTLTAGAGLSHVTATSGQTFQIATSYGAQFQASGNYQTTGNYQTAGNYVSTNAVSGFAVQTVSTMATSHVLMGNGGWSSIPTQTASLVNTSAVPLLASMATGTTSGANGAIATAAGAATVYFANSSSYAATGHTHNQYLATNSGIQSVNGSAAASNYVLAAGGYMTTASATSGLTFGVATSALSTVFQTAGNYQTTGNYASTNFSGFAEQTVSTKTASSEFLAADGGYYSIAGGGVTNNYSGGIFGAIQGGASTTVSSGTVYLQGSGVTLAFSTSTNGSHTLNISGGGGGGAATLSQYAYPRDWVMATSGSTLITSQVHLKHLEMQANVAISAIDLPLALGCGSTTSGTQSVTINATAVFYTMNAGVLSPFLAGTFTTGRTFTSNGTASIVGNRMFQIPLASTTVLTPNDYWIGYQVQMSGWSSTVVTNMIASGSVPSLFLDWGSSVTTSNGTNIQEFQGMIAAAMTATSNTWNSTAVNRGAASWYRANIPVLIRNVAY